MTIAVAVAVIFDSDGRILITQRPSHASHGGLWEFPGGKLEKGETALTALKREIKEEVGLDIFEAEPLTEIEHSYGDKDVLLLVYCIYKFVGIASCCESQIDFRWVEPARLNDFSFPQANEKIIELLKLTTF